MSSEAGRHRRPAVSPPPPPTRRPSRVAIATAGGTGSLALAVALVTVAAAPARNGDPGATRSEAAAPAVTSVPAPPSAGPGSRSTEVPGGTSFAAYPGAQRTALPLPPSSAPPRVAPKATTPTPNGKRNAYGHHRATPKPTPTGTTEGAPDVTAAAVPTVGLPLP
jgi:hypothetical protein